MLKLILGVRTGMYNDTYNINENTTINEWGLASELRPAYVAMNDDGFTQGNICKVCHDECAWGCKGTSDRHCISEWDEIYPDIKGCKNVQVFSILLMVKSNFFKSMDFFFEC